MGKFTVHLGFAPIAALLGAMLGIVSVSAAEPTFSAAETKTGLELFEKKIRPVLVAKCYECHSPQVKEPKGGLRVDTRAGLRVGGDSGPAVVPGDTDASLMLAALKHDGLEMPPTEKLSLEIVDDFVAWIKLGAPDPRDGPAVAGAGPKGIDLAAGRRFWCFQPLARPAPPAVQQAAWPHSDIDRFVLARLEAAGLTPGPDAPREDALRRLYFDLVGLPPDPAEIDAFLQDTSEQAWETVVDRLLSSEHFGERWGRHWLDVARYADSTGGSRSVILPHAWRYRDWVIAQFNADRPFAEFVADQIAGDLLPSATPQEAADRLIATGYLAIGPKNLDAQDKEILRMDTIDEQIDAIGKGLLGMTISCARCHDHKFDPIPTADYYALAGIFRATKVTNVANINTQVERPLPTAPPDLKQRHAAFAAKTKSLQAELAAAQAAVKKLEAPVASATDASSTPTGPSKLEFLGIVVDDAQAEKRGEWKPSTFSPHFVGAGYLHDDKTGDGKKSIVFTPDLPADGEYEVRLAYNHSTSRATNVPVAIHHAEGVARHTVNQREAPPISNVFRPLGRYRFVRGTAGQVAIVNEGTDGHVIVDAVEFVPVEKLKANPAAAGKPPMAAPAANAVKPAERERLHAEVKRLQSLLEEHKKQAPPPLPVCTAVEEEKEPSDYRINIRGNPHNLGPTIPRGALQVASVAPFPKISAGQSGRLELARWIVDPANPLTARVYVNRVWHHLLGRGIVPSTDNFGVTGDAPSHPDLLDWLAGEFQRSGSTKQLIRAIVLSRVYRLSSTPHPAAAKVDPENRLLARANLRRLDAESIRDLMLAVSGQLDRSVGGNVLPPGLDAGTENTFAFENRRRSVYVAIFRGGMHPLFEAFDFADPNMVVGARNTSTLATQALYLMNSPFALDQARKTAERLLAEKTAAGEELDDAARLDLLYRRTLGRFPRPAERELALKYLAAEPDKRDVAWAGVCQAVFGSVDARYLK